MKTNKLISARVLFLQITFVTLSVSLLIVYLLSSYFRDTAIESLTQYDAQKTSELTFEIISAKMQEGWTRDDLHAIIAKLNTLRDGQEIYTYRSTLVEELHGTVTSERISSKDALVQRAFDGETILQKLENEKIRYVRPILVKKECITCHYNTQVGDINGVIDIRFPVNDIHAPVDNVISNFLLMSLIAIVVIFIILYLLITKLFIEPISRFADKVNKVKDEGVYSDGISSAPKTHEIYMLGKTFNELSQRVHETLEKLKFKNKILEEYKKAIDESTIVSKTDKNGVITYVNDKFCELSGYSADELLGQSHNMVRSPNMPKEVFADLWKTIKAQTTWFGVVENRAKNGESYFVQATIIPILNDNNEIVEYIGIRQDITALKQFQFQELSKNVDKALQINLSEMIKCLPVCALIVDDESEIIFTNYLFQDKFSFMKDTKVALDSYFIEKEGYVSSHPIIDWKNEVYDFQHSMAQKIVVNAFEREEEFYIFIKPLKIGQKHLVLLFEA